jgi:hypothetical protein
VTPGGRYCSWTLPVCIAVAVGLVTAVSVADEQHSRSHHGCRWNTKRIDPVYEKLARQTGGQVIALNPCDKTGAGSVALAATLGDPVLSIDERLAGEKAYTFDVAPALRRVSVSATTVRRIRLERADGSVVAGGTEGVQHAKTLNGEAWIVDDPPPGTWTVRVRAAGEFTLRVNAQRSAVSASIPEPDAEGPPR